MRPALDRAAMLPRPLRPEQYAEQQRAFLGAVYPMTQMKVRLYSMFMPTVIVDAEGKLISEAYPDELQESVKKIDEAIQQVADSWPRP